jgi:hypothetical protein
MKRFDRGWLVVPIIFICVLGVYAGWSWIGSLGLPAYRPVKDAAPPDAAGLFLAGILCYLLGTKVRGATGRLIVDPVTGREMPDDPDHSLLFLKVEHWGMLCMLMAVVTLALDFF